MDPKRLSNRKGCDIGMTGQFDGPELEFQTIAIVTFLYCSSHLEPLRQYSGKLSTKVVLDQRNNAEGAPLTWGLSRPIC